jgi:hypothetical protein
MLLVAKVSEVNKVQKAKAYSNINYDHVILGSVLLVEFYVMCVVVLGYMIIKMCSNI